MGGENKERRELTSVTNSGPSSEYRGVGDRNINGGGAEDEIAMVLEESRWIRGISLLLKVSHLGVVSLNSTWRNSPW